MRVSVSGLDSIKQAQADLRRFMRDTDTIQDQELSNLVAEAYPEMIRETPYKTGALEASVYCRRSTRRGVVAGAYARNGEFNYSVIQHENTDYEHPIKGNAYYISGPLIRAIDNFMQRVKERVDGAW